MTIQQIYEKAIALGIKLDPRGEAEVRAELARTKKDYDEMKEADKAWFDTASLTNPYSDTRILYGDVNRKVKRVMIGVDMEVAELLLADRLAERGRPIDLVIAHHPEGRAMANLYGVMGMQAGILYKYGVPINIAEDIMDERIKEVERRLMPINHSRSVDAARLLDIPFMCVHTPTDNAVTDFLQNIFDTKKPLFVSDVMDIIKEIPEYKTSGIEGAPAKVVCGSKTRKAGKVFVDMTGGTGGSKKAFEKLAIAGVGTVVGMHISEDHRKEAEEHHINVVIAGHISSDNLGINLLYDKVLPKDVDVVAASGFRRVVRT
ncbi:MAG: NGG1p interacting factor NIF3 [Deltaproteobacteria bacterium]|nr:NGG1p interacting factor NIF3 [Deltaproteobacteria bacterium]